MSSAAKMVLNDFQRGKLPYYVRPPGCEKDEETAALVDELPTPEQLLELQAAAAAGGNAQKTDEDDEDDDDDETAASTGDADEGTANKRKKAKINVSKNEKKLAKKKRLGGKLNKKNK